MHMTMAGSSVSAVSSRMICIDELSGAPFKFKPESGFIRDARFQVLRRTAVQSRSESCDLRHELNTSRVEA